MTDETEPLRLRGYTALTVGAVLVAAYLWAALDATPQQVVGVLALMGLSEVGGLEWARRHVAPYEPEPDGLDL